MQRELLHVVCLPIDWHQVKAVLAIAERPARPVKTKHDQL